MKFGTSDLHFGHANIFKFTKRFPAVKAYIEEVMPVTFSHVYEALQDAYDNLIAGVATEEDRKVLISGHDMWLMNLINQQVSAGDTVIHTGDFSYYKGETKETLKLIVGNLNGNWLFILGNHDNESALREACKGTRHKVLGHYHEAKVNGRKVVLSHYPMQDWHGAHRGSYMLHGHLHGTDGHGDHIVHKIPRRFDIGLDAHPEMKLFNLEELVDEAQG